jgi:hypothetical protein
MDPIQSKTIGSHTVERFYWHGVWVVYIDNKRTDETFEAACERLKSDEMNLKHWSDPFGAGYI